jgi:hypothetical protein
MPSPGVSSVSDPRSLTPPPEQFTIKLSPFDQLHYQRLISAREETIRNVVQRIAPAPELKSALDAGAGVGFFSRTLSDCGLSVRAFDGRAETLLRLARGFLILLPSNGTSRTVPPWRWGNLTSFYVSDCFTSWKTLCWACDISGL